MLLTSFILFAITAFLGITMAGIREMSRHNPPALVTMLHGLPAAAGLTLLLYAVFTMPVPALVVIALILLLVAAAGGAVLNLWYQQRGRVLARWLMYLHMVLAVVGFALLAIDLFA
jgi:hypothetical protein